MEQGLADQAFALAFCSVRSFALLPLLPPLLPQHAAACFFHLVAAAPPLPSPNSIPAEPELLASSVSALKRLAAARYSPHFLPLFCSLPAFFRLDAEFGSGVSTQGFVEKIEFVRALIESAEQV